MISVNLIQRLFETRRHEQLLDAIAANGMELPLPLRARLAQTDIAPVALGLKRVTELTYGPTALTSTMTRYLLDRTQNSADYSRDPLATAAVAAALADPGNGMQSADDDAEQARYAAIAALAGMQADDGLFTSPDDRSEQDRALVAAFVLLLLAGDETFRLAVRTADLFNYFDEREDRLDRATERLWRMARSEAPLALAAA